MTTLKEAEQAFADCFTFKARRVKSGKHRFLRLELTCHPRFCGQWVKLDRAISLFEIKNSRISIRKYTQIQMIKEMLLYIQENFNHMLNLDHGERILLTHFKLGRID